MGQEGGKRKRGREDEREKEIMALMMGITWKVVLMAVRMAER